MRIHKLIFGVLISIAFFGANAFANTVYFEFTSLPDTAISFSGGHFTFSAMPDVLPPSNFVVTGPTDPGPPPTQTPLLGMFGQISGDFIIDGVTGNDLDGFFSTVSGLGGFKLYDGIGGEFSADLQFINVYQAGPGGTLNVLGEVNLSQLAYTYVHNIDPADDVFYQELAELASHNDGIVGVSFTLFGGTTLTELATVGTPSADYPFSGYLYSDSSPVVSTPEPASLLLFGAGLLGVVIVGRRRFPYSNL